MKEAHCVVAATLAVLSLPSAAEAQNNLFGKLLGALTQPAGQRNGPRPLISGRPSATVEPTSQQADAIHTAVMVRQPNPQVAADIASAAPLIERLAKTGACAVDNSAWNAFNREAIKPTNWWGFGYYARGNDQYHDSRFCYDVLRITEFSKPAANGLTFRVFYISPQSQRATSQQFTLLHSPEGNWMVKDIGWVG